MYAFRPYKYSEIFNHEKDLITQIRQMDPSLFLIRPSPIGTLVLIPTISWLNDQAERLGLTYRFVEYPGQLFSSTELKDYLRQRLIPISQDPRMSKHDILIHWVPNLLKLTPQFLEDLFEVLTLAAERNQLDLDNFYETLTLTGSGAIHNATFPSSLLANSARSHNERQEKIYQAREEIYQAINSYLTRPKIQIAKSSLPPVFIPDYVPD